MVPSLKSHSLCPNSKITVSDHKGRYRAARAARKKAKKTKTQKTKHKRQKTKTKREFNIATSGQFRTLAMFINCMVAVCPFHEIGYSMKRIFSKEVQTIMYTEMYLSTLGHFSFLFSHNINHLLIVFDFNFNITKKNTTVWPFHKV